MSNLKQDWKTIPIVVNNRNRYSSVIQLYWDLVLRGYNNIHILDNDSKYPGCKTLYRILEEKGVKVHYIEANSGSLALWNTGYINQFYNEPYIVYTDSDITLGRDCPNNFIERLVEVSKKYNYHKVGLALRIDNLPDTTYGNIAREHESKFWINELEKDLYKSDIDTTFAIIDPQKPFTYEAIRVAGDLTANHLPWYNQDPLSEEEKYVIKHNESKFSTQKQILLTYGQSPE